MSVIVAPSLLSCRFLEMGADIKRLDGIQDLWLHLDIMDGHFVPNLTFGEPVLNQIKTITIFTQTPLNGGCSLKNSFVFFNSTHFFDLNRTKFANFT